MDARPPFRSLLGCLWFLVAAASAQSQQGEPPWHSRMWLGVAPGRDGVILRVVSTGCTKREDFEFAAGTDGVIRVTRIRPDRCRKRPSLVEFSYTFAELGMNDPQFFELSRP